MQLRLREAMAERHEHHLVVVARVGDAVLECAVAGEPLAFAHRNISDEYALLLPSGDPLLDAFKGRTVIGDARVKHGAGDLVLHPHGALHWPGKLRPPYERIELPVRPRLLSVVICAARPSPPGEPREAFVIDTARHDPGPIGHIADARIELVRGPCDVEGPGVLVDIDRATLAPLPARFEGARGLALAGAPVARPPPIPDTPFHLEPRPLPVSIGNVTLTEPDFWLARMLFRVALHGLRLGYVETYNGFFCDDTGDLSLGFRGGPSATVPRAEAIRALHHLYCAVAPPGYIEV